jgi:hypothetical protein
LPCGNPGTAFTNSSGKLAATQTVSSVTRSHELLRSAQTSFSPVAVYQLSLTIKQNKQ